MPARFATHPPAVAGKSSGAAMLNRSAVFFQVFQNGDDQLLSRAWLIDPGETQANVAAASRTKGEKEPWIGEYYVSYGGADRSWDEARQYGFVSGGGGSWYSRTLKLLSPGDRIWVKIPKTGYVGVGRVTEAVCPVKDFKVSTPAGEGPVLDVLKAAEHYEKDADDPDLIEYFVRVEWLDAVPVRTAVLPAINRFSADYHQKSLGKARSQMG
jgi:hypothetical protein